MITDRKAFCLYIYNFPGNKRKFRPFYKSRFSITDVKHTDVVAVTSPYTNNFFIGEVLEVWMNRDTFVLYPFPRYNNRLKDKSTHSCSAEAINCIFKWEGNSS
jgi:hypothetical protein